PRHGGRPAVELLVEVVAEPADGLRGQDAGRDGVTERRQLDPAAPTADPRTQRTDRDRAPDAQAAVPDLQRVDRFGRAIGAEVGAPVGEHVIQPAADQAERHRPHGDVEHRALLAAARYPGPIDAPPRGQAADRYE